jgi:hypothetical protein
MASYEPKFRPIEMFRSRYTPAIAAAIGDEGTARAAGDMQKAQISGNLVGNLTGQATNTLGALLQQQERQSDPRYQADQMKLAQMKREQHDDDMVRQALSETGGDPDEALKTLRSSGQIGVSAATKLQAQVVAARKSANEDAFKTIEGTSKRLALQSQLFQGINDDPDPASAYQRTLPQVKAIWAPELGKLPETYDPTFVSQAVTWGETAQQNLERKRAAVLTAKEGLDAAKDARAADEYTTKALGQWLSTVESQDEWTEALASAKKNLGATDATLKKFGPTFSPAAAKRAESFTMTPAERVKASGQGANAGSFEDFVGRVAKEKGMPVGALSSKDIEAARKRYQQADDRPPVLGSMNAMYGAVDPEAIADAIIRGDNPPNIAELGRPVGAAVSSILAKKGYNLSGAKSDWTATQKHLATLNGAQQTRMQQAIVTAADSLGVIEDLAKKWNAGRFPALNRIQLKAAKSGVMGKDAQQIATNLEAQITDVTSELGNVYMGGNSPTDHALSLAAKNLSGDWEKDQLLSAITLARTNLNIRRNSMSTAGVVGASANNPYAPPPAAPSTGAPNAPAAAQPAGIVTVTSPSGKVYTYKDQAAADAFVAAAKAKGMWK